MQTYTAAYHWTQEELLRSMRHHHQTNLRPSIVMAVNIASSVFAALGIFVLTGDNLDLSAIVSAFTFIGFAIYWLFLRKKVTSWWLSRGFSKRPDANVLVHWEISEEKVSNHCEGLASAEAHWKLFIRVVETSDGFLFYLQKNLFYWIPFSAFEEKEGVEKVRQFVKDNDVQYMLMAS